MKLASAVLLALSALAPAPSCAADPRLEAPTPASHAAFLCLAYGEGFVPVAGTNTCVRAGGDLEAAVLSSKLSTSGFRPSPAGGTKGRENLQARPRTGGFTRVYGGAAVEFESHTPTDFGNIDTHIRVENWQQLSR